MENLTKQNFFSAIAENAKMLVNKVTNSDAGPIFAGAILVGGIVCVGKLMFDAMSNRRVIENS